MLEAHPFSMATGLSLDMAQSGGLCTPSTHPESQWGLRVPRCAWQRPYKKRSPTPRCVQSFGCCPCAWEAGGDAWTWDQNSAHTGLERVLSTADNAHTTLMIHPEEEELLCCL